MGLEHLVFDVETLGLREDTVVLSLACVPFQFETFKSYGERVLDGFYVKFNAEEQITNHHRSTTKSTIDWWKQQSPEAKKYSLTPHKDDVSMEAGLKQLRDWIKTTKYDYKNSYIWSRGTYFDFPKIEHMYWQLDQEIPANTWRIRDVRTYIDVLTGVSNGKYDPIKAEKNLNAYSLVEIYLSATESNPAF